MDGGNIPPPVPVKLTRLGDDVWISEGDSTSSNKSGPEVILIFSWMDARIGHIIKYASHHRELYPGATIVVVQTFSSFFWSSDTYHRAILGPVIDLLKGKGIVGVPGATPPSLLIHAFSNGGTSQLAKLTNIISEDFKSTSNTPALPVSAIIFDSCPGDTSLYPLLQAFTMNTPWYAKPPIYAVLTTLWCTLFCYDKLIASEPGHILKVRRDLNDPIQLPQSAKRLYIYSETDALVPFASVEEHAAEARKLGMTVETEMYNESPHCAHARTDGKRYWSTVASFWRRSMS